jgi:hypothetical protein
MQALAKVVLRWQDLNKMSRDLLAMRQRRYRERLASQPDWLSPRHKSIAVAVYIFSNHSA